LNYLFDLNHPAHFHLFKNSIQALKKSGHNVFITARPKDVLLQLLMHSGLKYILLDKSKNLVFEHIVNVFSMYQIFRTNSIDIAIGVSIYIAQASKLCKTKSIVFDDDDISVTRLFALLSHTFANNVFSPLVLMKERNRQKDIFHNSLHELAYLHPNYFRPRQNILNKYQLHKNEFFSILRLSALKAHHDRGEEGLTVNQCLKLINELEKYGRVLISSEIEMPEIQSRYYSIEPSDFHDVMSYSGILVCDSQTVASEASVLGVPSVRINSFVGRISVLEELENKYHLTFGFKPKCFDEALNKIKELIISKDTKGKFKKKRTHLIDDKIDLTAFFLWFIENYPKSITKVMENNNYQYNFK
jgi:predicted glycosyltransferase